jgi:hypothetical protein
VSGSSEHSHSKHRIIISLWRLCSFFHFSIRYWDPRLHKWSQERHQMRRCFYFPLFWVGSPKRCQHSIVGYHPVAFNYLDV